MIKTRCLPCSGSGKMMGGGMLLADCPHCEGVGKIIEIEKPEIKIDKKSSHYKKAIKSLKELDSKLTDAEADKIFTEEFEKLES